jgi:XTP/dITP diphosphohydrolase
MRLERAVLATKNPDKRAELAEVLASHAIELVDGLTWADVPETEPTLEGNALLKARAVAAATGLAAIADDTGLEVAALDGAPGVTTARFAGPNASYADNVAALLGALEGVADRRAAFRTAVAVVEPSGEELVVEGRLEGRITTAPRGQGGFGYDPVFEVDGVTLAEMAPSEKHAISHRGRALAALAEALGDRITR